MNGLKKVYWWIINGCIIVVSTLFAVIVPECIQINENHVLYYMSCLAQVTAAMYALVLAAYTIADARLKNMVADDDTLCDYVPELQNEHFHRIVTISVNCIVTIFLCFLTINIYDILSQKIFSALIIDTGVLGSISIISLTFFVCSVCDPKAFQKKGKAMKDEMDQSYGESESENDKSIDFRTFLGCYNQLEFLIFKFAKDAMNDGTDYRYQHKQILIFQALDILMSREIIDKYIYMKIDGFRRYRNALVHSPAPEAVNSIIYDELKEVFDQLEKIYSEKGDDNKRQKILKLSEYCKEHLVEADLEGKYVKRVSRHRL